MKASPSERFFRFLLRAYPPAFRDAFGKEMVQTFRDLSRAAGKQSGARGLVRLWCSTIFDVLRSALQERGETMRSGWSVRDTILLVLAVAMGLLLQWVDSRPHWDDTGITAGSLLIVCAVFGLLQPARPWLWALAVGAWIPLFAIVQSHNYGSLLALLFSFAGAYLGALVRRLLSGLAGTA